MNGTGSLLKLGTGTLTLASPNSYTGGTVVTDGGLTGTTDSLQGNILNNALVTFDQDFDGTFSGLMTGNGTLIKTGSGKVSIINSVPTISTTISNGDLNVNGVLASPLITVENAGSLSGSGMILGNVINKGLVSPGNSPGTLTISGDYTQDSNSTLRIEIVDHSNYDKLIVGGKASLGGGLQVIPSQSLVVKYGDRFDIIFADQISGEFASVVTQSQTVRARFVNFGTIGALLITPADLADVAVTPNQKEVASILNNYRNSSCPDSVRVTLALDFLTAEQYPAAFEQIMPSIYESYVDLSIEQSFINMQMINQRLGSIRLGSAGFAAYGIEQPIKYDRDGRNTLEPSDLKSHVEGYQDQNWNLWVMGTGIFSNSRNLNSVPDYRSNSGGFIVGSDYSFNENLKVGFYSGYQYSYTRYENESSLKANSLLYGLYSSFVKDGYFADAVVGGGYTGGQANREIQFGTLDRSAKSDPNNALFTAGLNLGKDWSIKNFIITPMAGAQYTYIASPEFTESGAESLDLTLKQQNVSSLRTTLGGRIAYPWEAPIKLFNQALLIAPEVRMFWVHEFMDDARAMQASLNGCEVESFEYMTNAPIRNSVFAGVGFSAQIGKNWNCSAFYNAAFNSNNLTSNIVSVGLGFSF
jgi:outer membrane autotransporter protein